MIYPAISRLLDKVDNRYTLVMEIAKRARQIANGDTPKTTADEESSVTLAANEIAEGKVFVKE